MSQLTSVESLPPNSKIFSVLLLYTVWSFLIPLPHRTVEGGMVPRQ